VSTVPVADGIVTSVDDPRLIGSRCAD